MLVGFAVYGVQCYNDTSSYRRLRKRNVIHVYRLGMIEDNVAFDYKSESDGINFLPDSVYHYETSEDITQAEYSQYHGPLVKGINQLKLKSSLNIFKSFGATNVVFEPSEIPYTALPHAY